MRIHELLLEYDVQKTIENYGDRIIKAFSLFHPNAFGPSYNLIHTANVIKNSEQIRKQKMPPVRVEITPPLTDRNEQFVSSSDIEEIVQSRRQQMIKEVLDLVESRDPTQNKQYTVWMLRSWLNNNGTIRLDNLNRFRLIEIFHRAKERGLIRPEDRDINQFKTYEDFELMMGKYDAEEMLTGQPPDRGRSREIYSGSDARIIIPLDFKASDYYGRGTLWCTAGKSPDAPIKFQEYTSEGPLYIILPKKPEYRGEKYQLHTVRAEFTKSDNIRQPLYFLKQRFPEAAEFLFTDDYNFRNTLELADLNLIDDLWWSTVLGMRIWVRDNVQDPKKSNRISETLKEIGDYDTHLIMNTIGDYDQVIKAYTKVNHLPLVITYQLDGIVGLGDLESELEKAVVVVNSENSDHLYKRPVKTIGDWTVGIV